MKKKKNLGFIEIDNDDTRRRRTIASPIYFPRQNKPCRNLCIYVWNALGILLCLRTHAHDIIILYWPMLRSIICCKPCSSTHNNYMIEVIGNNNNNKNNNNDIIDKLKRKTCWMCCRWIRLIFFFWCSLPNTRDGWLLPAEGLRAYQKNCCQMLHSILLAVHTPRRDTVVESARGRKRKRTHQWVSLCATHRHG